MELAGSSRHPKQRRRPCLRNSVTALALFLLGVSAGVAGTLYAQLGNTSLLTFERGGGLALQRKRNLLQALDTGIESRVDAPLLRKRRNLVLALGTGAEYVGAPGVRFVARFAGSFRRFNTDADIIWFTDAVDPEVGKLLPAVDMQAVVFPKATSMSLWHDIEVAARRWHIYRQFLMAHPEYSTGWALAIDARDSFFQADPFAYAPTHDNAETPQLFVFMEHEDPSLGKIEDNQWNRDVIRACYNDTEYEAIKFGRVSCSGTVMGSFSGMMKYLHLMEKEILQKSHDNATCMATGGRDQGFHNVLINRGDLSRVMPVRYFNNENSTLVRTLGSVNGYHNDFMGRVLNSDGELVTIVHQWDRDEGVRSVIDQQLFPIVNPNAYMAPPRRRSRDELVRADGSDWGQWLQALREEAAAASANVSAVPDEGGSDAVNAKALAGS